MRSLLITFTFLLSASLLAADKPSEKYMSLKEQGEYITKTAKNIRRSYWIQGHEEVSSSETFVTKKILDNHYADNSSFENSLDDEEFSQLYRCYNSKKCELYLVNVSGSYWGGWGQSAHFVLLFTEKKRHSEISHVVYAE